VEGMRIGIAGWLTRSSLAGFLAAGSAASGKFAGSFSDEQWILRTVFYLLMVLVSSRFSSLRT